MKHERLHDENWNPWEGCIKCSEGCKNCLMFSSLRQYRRDPTAVRRCKTTWNKPGKWQKAAEEAGERRVKGCCFMSDFFIPEADPWRPEAWKILRITPNLIWNICTKRTHRIADCLPPDWDTGYPNIALGASVEMKKHLDRLDDLRRVPAAFRYANICPCLEDVTPELGDHLDGIGLVSISGETGCGVVNPRPFDDQWARNVRDLCDARGIPFRFGHTGGRKRLPSTLLDGVERKDIPTFFTGPQPEGGRS
jgi:protein gp37